MISSVDTIMPGQVRPAKRALNHGENRHFRRRANPSQTKFPMTLINTNNEVLRPSCRIIETNESFSFDSFS